MKTYLFSFLLLISCPLLAHADSPWQCLDPELQKIRFLPKSKLVCIVGTYGCLLLSADSGATWKQPFTGTLKQLTAIDFATPSIGVLVGFGGVISRTTDGGKTWKLVPSPTTNILTSVQFMSPTEGFAGGQNSTLLKTTDAGLTWQTMDFPYSFSITTISMDSPSTGFIAGDGSNFLRTSDGGLHWTPQTVPNLPFGNYIYQDCIRTNGKIYLFGGNIEQQKGVLISSNDGLLFSASEIPLANDIAIVNDSIYTISTTDGISKSSLSSLQFTSVPLSDTTYPIVLGFARKNSLCFIGNTIALAVGERKFIYRAVTDMDKWNLISYVSGYAYNDPISSTPDFFKVNFINDSTGFLLGALRAIYHTTNGGATWLPQRSSSIELYDMYDIAFTSSTNGFAVGSNAKYSVVKTIDGGKTFIPNDTVNQGFLPVGDNPDISFLSDSLGLISGSYSNPSSGIVNLTFNGGKKWERKKFDIRFTDSRWVDSTTVLLTGDKNYFPNSKPTEVFLVMSQDKGVTWDSILIPFTSSLLGCWVIDSENFLLTGGFKDSLRTFGHILRSADRGKTWKVVDSSTTRYYYHAIDFSNEKVGYTINRSLMQTKDGGNTWKAIAENPLDTGYFVRLSALPGGNVILTTNQPKVVLRSNFSEEVLTVEEPKAMIEQAASVWLYAPRPVPTTGKINLDAIWVMNLDVSTIRIKLYDMLGIELQDITDSFHTNSGTNTGIVEFDGSKLPTGIYYIEINGGGYRKAVPVIIAR